MGIIHYLDSIDKQWLLALNNDYASLWDNVMVLISAKNTWIPFYAAILFVVIKHWKKNSWVVVLALVFCIIIADQTASGLLKNIVHRLRPTKDPSIQNLVEIVQGIRGGGMYGFVSSHAANSFGLALLTSLLFRNKIYTVFVFIWALLVALSRVYLGVHYPGDILGGAIVGVFSALLVYWLLKKIRPQLISGDNSQIQLTIVPLWVLLATFVAFFVYSVIV